MQTWKPKKNNLIIIDKKLPKIDKVQRFNFKKMVKPPTKFWIWLERSIKKILLKEYDHKITFDPKYDEKKQYLIVGGHMSFLDIPALVDCFPKKQLSYVMAIDGANDFTEWLTNTIGVISKRKFVQDLNLLKNMKHIVTKYKKNSIVLYPEAKYSLQGSMSFVPPSLGKLAKFLGLPVLVCILHGDYVASPQWRQKQIVSPLHTEIKLVISEEELKTLSEKEINARIIKEMYRDDFAWQKENNIIIDDPDRAYQLNSLLYQCPHCGKEYEMEAVNTTIKCNSCHKEWEMTTLGELKALEGETEFSHIPNWFDWERDNIKKEILDGNYFFSEEVVVHTQPIGRRFRRCLKSGFYHHGLGKITHDKDGVFTLDANCYGVPTHLTLSPKTLDGVYIEYRYKGTEDCFVLSTLDESYWCYPTKRKDVITKLSLATDIFYEINSAEKTVKS